jgi:CSLREA domain-containing protein
VDGALGSFSAAGRVATARVVAATFFSVLLIAGSAHAATVTVTTLADDLTPNDGSVSLREAITAINAGNNLGDPDIIAQNPGTFGSHDAISFNIPGTGRQTIRVGSTGNGALPALTKPVTINGYTQPGSSQNTLAHGDNANILIALDGAGAGPNADGIHVNSGGANSIIDGLDIFDFSDSQIYIVGGNQLVAGDYVGYDSTGAPTRSPVGVLIQGSSNNVIGDNAGPAARNLISGNLGAAVAIFGETGIPASSNVVQNNFIGTVPSGMHADPNAFYSPNSTVGAVWIDGGTSNFIGGKTAGQGNVISGNGAGVNITNGGQDNVVQGNLIGVAADGKTPLGNTNYGVRVGSNDNLPPPNGPGQANEPASSSNIIGVGPTALSGGGANVIAFNGTDGVLIQGTPQNNVTQAQDAGNSILGNSIFSNHGLGIDLLPETLGLAPNNSLPRPSITSTTPTSVHATLPLGGHGGMTTLVEAFASSSCGVGGHGQGQTLVGSGSFTTSNAGNTNVTLSVKPLTPGQIVTATATNTTADPTVPGGSANLYDTSEFSSCFAVPKRSTSTKVVCKPASVEVSSATTCTATVSDTATGTSTTPTGTVHFSTSGKGSFSGSGSCKLSGGHCALTFKPTTVGSGKQTLTAAYGGDSRHTASKGHATETVTS